EIKNPPEPVFFFFIFAQNKSIYTYAMSNNWYFKVIFKRSEYYGQVLSLPVTSLGASLFIYCRKSYLADYDISINPDTVFSDYIRCISNRKYGRSVYRFLYEMDLALRIIQII